MNKRNLSRAHLKTEFGISTMKKSRLNMGYWSLLDKEKESDYNITLSDLDGRYKQFCQYSKEPMYRYRIKMWGRPTQSLNFKGDK